MNAIIKSILLIAVISLLIFLGLNSTKHTLNYIENSQKISKLNDADHKLGQKVNKLLKNITGGIYKEYNKKKKSLKKLQDKTDNAKQKGLTYMYYFFATILIFIIIFLVLDREFLIIFIALSAFVSLFFGLSTPLIMIVVYKALPIVGMVTLSFDTKTILTTIQEIYGHGNYFIATIILSVSVLIPIIKTLVVLLYGFLKESGLGKSIVNAINKLGKWSMADVFIVAFLVVFFSTKQDIHSTLKIEIGLYFFLAYVLLSMLGSSLIGKNHK